MIVTPRDTNSDTEEEGRMELESDGLVSPIQEVPVIEGELVATIRELAGPRRLPARSAWHAILCAGICGSRSRVRVIRRAGGASRAVDGARRRADPRTTHEAPIIRFDHDERAALRPLPMRAPPRREQRLRRRSPTTRSSTLTRCATACRIASCVITSTSSSMSSRPHLPRRDPGRDPRAVFRAVCSGH